MKCKRHLGVIMLSDRHTGVHVENDSYMGVNIPSNRYLGFDNRYRKVKGQSTMDNPETHTTLGTKRKTKTHKIK